MIFQIDSQQFKQCVEETVFSPPIKFTKNVSQEQMELLANLRMIAKQNTCALTQHVRFGLMLLYLFCYVIRSYLNTVKSTSHFLAY